MTPWPSLAPYAQTIPLTGGDLFYYDTKKPLPDSPLPVPDSPLPHKKPTIVLIHGLADEADTWRHIIHALADTGCRIIAPDLPGFGRSL